MVSSFVESSSCLYFEARHLVFAFLGFGFKSFFFVLSFLFAGCFVGLVLPRQRYCV
jgi:hypothetical protein